ncbi:IPT/TIG domain-containing protein [Streptomyces sp. NBC_00638]|uniref:IPT/TIG domain-containing protein n=1 Tax=unclassified Streptomyces TaxID=2593676 RepID=UPI002251545F|nr:IPT/TIG domain-containing protein [Streptomyces sp. NBC_00638]MCX5001196.1 IPT/TIG domain-containing protein [Streptomyces sp. NBC_00638]
MGDYSKSPQELLRWSRSQGYVGIHMEQGVPILDRDLNLMQDLLANTVRDVLTRYIGNGTAQGDDGFGIEALPAQDGQNQHDFRITTGTAGTGSCLVGGIEVRIAQAITYSSQQLDELTTPTVPRKDLVYLDVSLVEEDGTFDRELLNSEDVGVRTSVRLKPAWVVRVREGYEEVPDPPEEGHAYHRLALLARPAGKDVIEQSDIRDLRARRLTVSDLESRLSLMERLLARPKFIPEAAPEFMPRSGVVNQSVILSGGNFDVGTARVFFGGEEAVIEGAPTATKVVARVPAGLTPGGSPEHVEVSIENDVGGATATRRFTVLPNPVFAPSGRQFSPDHGVPQTAVALFGFNFGFGVPEISFGDVPAEVVGAPSKTEIRVRVPDGLVPPGTESVDVPIAVRIGANVTISEDLFKAEPSIPKPTFGSVPFTPKLGQVGQLVTLRGTNFNVGNAQVFLGNKEAEIQGAPTATEIVVKVPTGLSAGPVDVKVQTRGGTVTSPEKFTVQT